MAHVCQLDSGLRLSVASVVGVGLFGKPLLIRADPSAPVVESLLSFFATIKIFLVVQLLTGRVASTHLTLG